MAKVNGFSNYPTWECYKDFFADATLENVYDDPNEEFELYCEDVSKNMAEGFMVADIAEKLRDAVVETFKFNVDYKLYKEVYGWALLAINNVNFEEIAQLLFDEWTFQSTWELTAQQQGSTPLLPINLLKLQNILQTWTAVLAGRRHKFFASTARIVYLYILHKKFHSILCILYVDFLPKIWYNVSRVKEETLKPLLTLWRILL